MNNRSLCPPGCYTHLVRQEDARHGAAVVEHALGVEVSLPRQRVLKRATLRQVEHDDAGVRVAVVDARDRQEALLTCADRRVTSARAHDDTGVID